MLDQAFNIKPEVRIEDFLKMNPRLFVILGWFMEFAKQHGLPVVITSMFSDQASNRVSQTHSTGRAVDLSSRGWHRSRIDECLKFITSRCGEIGAKGTDGTKRAIIHHDVGSGAHFHIQTHP